jgi:hypothetical protein
MELVVVDRASPRLDLGKVAPSRSSPCAQKASRIVRALLNNPQELWRGTVSPAALEAGTEVPVSQPHHGVLLVDQIHAELDAACQRRPS